MKTENDNQLNNEALAKFLSGEMSESEERDFVEGSTDDEKQKISLEMMKKTWSNISHIKNTKEPDTGKAWDKLHSRLESEGLISNNEFQPAQKMIPAFVRIAAVFIVLISTGIILYLSFGRKPLVEMVQLNTSKENGTLIKTLNDGSVIYIAQNSHFSFPQQFNRDSRNVELEGEAFFDIAPNPQKPFIIETGKVIIEVLGTAFNVKTQNSDGFELIVDRGKVKVSLKSDPASYELIGAGEKVQVVKSNLVKTKHSSSVDWYKKRMHFKDESLLNIVNVLNRNFNTNFVIADMQTGNRKLTVTFSNETAEEMTGLICLTLNLESQKINGSVVLSDKSFDVEPK